MQLFGFIIRIVRDLVGQEARRYRWSCLHTSSLNKHVALLRFHLLPNTRCHLFQLKLAAGIMDEYCKKEIKFFFSNKIDENTRRSAKSFCLSVGMNASLL